MDLTRFLMIGFFIIKYLQNMSCEMFYLSNVGRKQPVMIQYQKRSERIRLVPYSFIALTRSCLSMILFIAIPP